MIFDLMAERTRYLKEDPKGVKIMCKAMEDMRKEAAEEAARKKAIEMAKKMIKRGKMTLEEIAEDSGLSLTKVQELAQAATA